MARIQIVYTVVPPMYAPADIFSNLDVYLRIKTKLVTAGAERAVQYSICLVFVQDIYLITFEPVICILFLLKFLLQLSSLSISHYFFVLFFLCNCTISMVKCAGYRGECGTAGTAHSGRIFPSSASTNICNYHS